MLSATSSSDRRFLTVEPYYRPPYGMRGLSLSNDFCSYGRHSHYPFVACLDLSPIRGSRSCLAVKSLRVLFDADLILSLLTVSLIEARVLPTDSANCRVSIWGPGPTIMRFQPKEP